MVRGAWETTQLFMSNFSCEVGIIKANELACDFVH
jgi:hypothetical protein